MVTLQWLPGVYDLMVLGWGGEWPWLNRESIHGFVEACGGWAPVIFCAVVFLATLLFVPITVFAVLSGSLFGPFLGCTLLTGSVTLAALAAFRIGRRLSGDSPWRQWWQGPGARRWATKIEGLLSKKGFLAFIVLRNLPHPFILVSYASGWVKTARELDFVSATLLVLGVRSLAFVYLGDRLFSGPQALVLPVVFILGITLITIVFDRRTRVGMKLESGQVTGEPGPETTRS